MTVTYDLTTLVGKVRFNCADNDITNAWLTDEEVQLCLSDSGNEIISAAVKACDHIVLKLALIPPFTADGLKIDTSALVKQYDNLSKKLATKLRGSLTTIPMDREDGFSEFASSIEGEYVA